MKKTLPLLLLLTLILSACSAALTSAPTVIVEPTNLPQTGNLPQSEADVPRVTVEETLTVLNSGIAIIVDVRSEQSFAAGHIEGAVNIPLTQVEADASSLPLDKNLWIITYCT